MSRRKVQIIREYETNNNDSPQETTITQTSSKSSGGRISSEKPLKPMKIDIVRDNRSNNEVVPAQQPPASFGDMQAKMEAEMETRRLDWEKEVEKMQKEFFKMPAGGAPVGTKDASGNPITIQPTNVPSARSEIFDINNTKNIYHYKPDGTKVYRLRFNVKDFAPGEISVKGEGRKLNVSAKHEDQPGEGQRTARNFNRQMDIPPGVDPEHLVAELSSDGILTVEAPVDEEEAERVKANTRVVTGIVDPRDFGNYDTVTESYSVGDPFKDVKQHIPQFVPHYSQETSEVYGSGDGGYSGGNIMGGFDMIGSGPESAFTVVHSEHGHGFPGHTCHGSSRPKLHAGAGGRYTSPHIEEVSENARKMKLQVVIGSEYKPGDIEVQLDGHHINVKAKHEEKTLSGRTAKREFTRQFDIPERIDPKTLRAVLGPDGHLIVGASLTSNKDHHAALESIKRDMPRGGKQVNISV